MRSKKTGMYVESVSSKFATSATDMLSVCYIPRNTISHVHGEMKYSEQGGPKDIVVGTRWA
jgi:hypothetical protein